MIFSKKFKEKMGNQFQHFFANVWMRLDWRKPKADNVKVFLSEQVERAIEFKKLGVLPTFRGTQDSKVLKVLNWVHTYLTYESDSVRFKVAEKWQTIDESLDFQRGDCIAEYEEIYTRDGIKSAKDIKIGDEVLSYDLNKKEYVYKPIINKWDKGILNVKRVHFRNGQHIDVTDNHHMMVRTNQTGDSVYEKRDLKDIDLTRWWKRKVPIAKKIPYIKSVPLWNKEVYRVIGHYLAEGWNDKYKVISSGYELNEDIIPILEKENIPFTEFKNSSGVPCIRFLKSNFKEYLKPLKKNSFNINLNEELLTLTEEYLEELLYGMWLGDGTKYQYPDKRGYENNKEWTYSTSSKQLADDIQRIGLQIGRTFHIWKQNNHKGVGNQPIYRINYNPNSHFLKEYGYKDLSEVSISHIEDLGEFQTYDWEVKDTHNFVFKNGIITFQCEDGAILIYAICIANGVNPAQLTLNAGDVKGGGHAWVEYASDEMYDYNNDEMVWYTIDWCYWFDNSKFKDREPKSENYYKNWFKINHKTESFK